MHFIYEIKTKGYDVIGVNVFHTKLIKPTKKVNSVPTVLYLHGTQKQDIT